MEADDSEDAPEKAKRFTMDDLRKLFPLGMMTWGKLPGYNWWPGSVISYDEGGGGGAGGERGGEPQVWIKWYGDNQLSQVRSCLPLIYKFLCSGSWSHSQNPVYCTILRVWVPDCTVPILSTTC